MHLKLLAMFAYKLENKDNVTKNSKLVNIRIIIILYNVKPQLLICFFLKMKTSSK